MKVLFVTWDGPQVSYLEGLFLPIFQRLSQMGLRFHVLQFTWGEATIKEARRQACEQAGVSYRAVTIWRRPRAAGSLLTTIKGSYDVRKAIRDFNIDVVMPRSTMPALATLLALRGSTVPIMFDADGLPLDERVDFAGQSPSSAGYRFLRDIEAQTVRRASVVLTRSTKAMDILLARAGAGTVQDKFHVVSNGRDADLFSSRDVETRSRVRQALGVEQDAPLLVYAGSMGQQYCLDEMLQLFALVRQRRPDAQLMILTGLPEWVNRTLGAYPELASAATVMTVSARDVPEYLASADLGLALRQPSFSMQAVAPIKLGEYLLCGLPVVATVGIGDTDAISAESGFLLHHMDNSELKAAAEWFIDIVLPRRDAYRARCREAGIAHFSLEASIQSYIKAFSHLAPQIRIAANAAEEVADHG